MITSQFSRLAASASLFAIFLVPLQAPAALAHETGNVVVASLAPPASDPAIISDAVSKPKAARPAAEAVRGIVRLSGYSPGTIVIKTKQRRLYYVVENDKALRYPVGVGRVDQQWVGSSVVSGKYLKPAWSPPADLKRANPNLPPVIPSGAPNNPMGAAALTLAGGDYAIHGTNKPESIGGFVSWGCIRMHNADVLDLFDRVAVGTPVIVER
jgi:lipoprotein-anchoring transpeptidase ErfK/SrfK